MTGIKNSRLYTQVSIAPLISFRILFGLLMLFCTIRFWYNGWIESIYITPKFHFTFLFFDWIKPLDATGMYAVFIIIAVTSLCIALGFLYRIAAILFFIAFTYVELIDSSAYLNHYYFISLVAFIMIWLPANRQYAVDAVMQPSIRTDFVPAWTIDIIRFQLCIVYFFAGLAKLNYDWLVLAEPMKTWLPANSYLPVVGKYMYQEWVAYLFSWFGAAYDLLIVFFLLNKKTRPFAYVAVLVFHLATAIFFPGIGMFPYIMMASTLIFFSGNFHQKLLSILPGYQKALAFSNTSISNLISFGYSKAFVACLGLYMLLQLIIPLRFLFYPGNLFWHEQGYRFSWRVMLMEKAGAAYFTVKDKTGNQFYEVNNKEFLTTSQEKMMSTQPDMILRYAHYLAKRYAARGIADPKVFAEVYVSLNGRQTKLFIDSTVDLAKEPLRLKNYKWVLPATKE